MPWTTLDEWWREVGEGELRLILWAAWDPIGMVPRSEYDWYVPKLWGLLREHAVLVGSVSAAEYEELSEVEQDEHTDRVVASERRIAAQLSEWRTEHMGLDADAVADGMVARKLHDWLSPVTPMEFTPSDLPIDSRL